jgi:hypothetical protein
MSWVLDGVCMNVPIWADDLIVCVPTKAALADKIGLLREALAGKGLKFKKEGLVWSCSENWAGDRCDIALRGGLNVTFAHQVEVLGVIIDTKASTAKALEHRMTLAWRHFWSRKHQLAAKRIPLRLRINKFMCTALLCYGGGSLGTKC